MKRALLCLFLLISASVFSQANLVVVNTDNSATYTAGQIRTYTVTVTNNGPEIATNVVVSDVLPVGIDMTTVSWSGSNGTTGTGGLNDTIATLANQGVVTYTVNIPVPSDYDQEENLVYEIVLTSTSVDPVPECEFCIDTDTPAPLADLVITKTNGQTQYLLGENTTYTITITNNGPSDVVNAVVNDPLPLGITTMTWSSSMGTSGTGAISDAISAITNGQVITYTVVVSVPVGFLGNLTNVVSVVSATPDPVPGCPQCSDTDTPRPKFISTSTTQYTVPELVTDVLVDSECALISNITWSSGTGNTSGIGYFHRQNSDFPLKSGVLLSTASAITAPGPATNTSTTGAAGSDAELLSYMQSLGLDPTLSSYNNVTKIEFDFTPLTDNMSFNFLFASDEYGTFQCNWSDAFAFFLTNTVTNTTTNLALVPNTATPVSVITIRDNVNNTTCNSVNPEYFGQFNGGSNISAINFEGQTVVMNASSEVVPYTVYHIKLVIGNRNDTSFNSAVFLEAGSFNIGQANIGDDLTIVTGQAICFGDTTVLDSALDPTIYEFEWRNNDVIIPGETGPILVVSEAGEYSLIASNIGTDCEMRDSIIIEFNPPLPVEDPIDLIQCQPLFNLRENQAIILANVPVAEQANYEFYYYASQADFDNSILIGNPDAYLSAGNQTIIIKVEDLVTSTQCDAIFSFDLIVESCTPPQPADMSICDELPNDGQAVFDLTINDALVLDGEPASENTVTYHLTQDDANNGTPFISPANAYLGSNNQTIYVRVQNNDDPLAVGFTNFNLIVIPTPEVVEMADVVICDEYILPAVTVGNYFTGANGSGTQLQPGASITSSQTIYVYAQSGTVPNCTDEDSFTVEINITPVVDEPLDVVRCNEYVLPELTVGNYFTAPDGSGTPLFAGDVITTTQLVYIYAETGTVPNCSDQSSFTISIFESPEAVTPLPLEVCDDNNDGIAAFLLSSKTGEIAAGNAGLVVTYHETLTNAQNNVLPLGASYTNINAWTQTVYARVTNAGATDCATIVELVLVVNPRPVPNAISNYELCDTVTPGDLIEEFLLSTKTAEATGGQAGISISYHATLADAQTGVSSIDPNVPYANTPAGTQQIFVRIQNDATGCSAATSFNLIVNPLPSPVAPTPLAACSDGVNNTQAVFNLTTKTNEILGGQSGFSITYYESAADAGLGTNPINPANAYLGQDGQVIHVRMENEDTGCSNTTELTLQVIVGPVANDPQPLTYCDPNNDGFGT
ncbi:choice-of-anchor L domain-containing protein, partial [Flavobacterium macacae]